MTTDNKTLADVQPGGRVRLGDQAERARFEAWNRENWPNLDLSRGPLGDYMQARVRSDWQLWQAAQPSPGGQRDDSPMAKMAAALRGKAEAERAAFDQRVQSGEWGPMPDNPDVLELPPLPEEVDSVRCMIRGEKGFAEPCDYYFTSKQMRDYARTALAASQPVGATGKNSLTVGGGQEPVAYLDLGEGGYMDAGTDLSDEELAALPKGRHMLGIIGTYGVDGYKPAQAVDLGELRAKVAELLRRDLDLEIADPEDHRHDDGSNEADQIAGRIVALLNSQGVGNK